MERGQVNPFAVPEEPAEASKRLNCVARWFTPKRAVLCFTICCLLNYLDRGIIAGASQQIKGCVYDFKACPLQRDQTKEKLLN